MQNKSGIAWLVTVFGSIWLGLKLLSDVLGTVTPMFEANSAVAFLNQFLEGTPPWLPPIVIAAGLIGLLAFSFFGKEKSSTATPDNVESPSKTEEIIMAGDNYHNSGTNYGHMGPVNNYGRQTLEFNKTVRDLILANIPQDREITIEIVGGHQAQRVGKEIAQFMRSAGYKFGEVETTGTMNSPPEHALTFDGKRLVIAPEV